MDQIELSNRFCIQPFQNNIGCRFDNCQNDSGLALVMKIRTDSHFTSVYRAGSYICLSHLDDILQFFEDPDYGLDAPINYHGGVSAHGKVNGDVDELGVCEECGDLYRAVRHDGVYVFIRRFWYHQSCIDSLVERLDSVWDDHSAELLEYRMSEQD